MIFLVLVTSAGTLAWEANDIGACLAAAALGPRVVAAISAEYEAVGLEPIRYIDAYCQTGVEE